MILLPLNSDIFKITNVIHIATIVNPTSEATYYQITREAHKTNQYSGNREDTYTIIKFSGGEQLGEVNVLYINGVLGSIVQRISGTNNEFENLDSQVDIAFIQKIISCYGKEEDTLLCSQIMITNYILKLQQKDFQGLTTDIADKLDALRVEYDQKVAALKAQFAEEKAAALSNLVTKVDALKAQFPEEQAAVLSNLVQAATLDVELDPDDVSFLGNASAAAADA